MMNDLIHNGDKRMTVREVADALGVAPVTVNQNISKLFPGLARNGVTTYLDEEQVTQIKQAIMRSGRNDLMNIHKVADATTALEIEEMTLKVISFHKSEVERLRAELTIAAPKIECADALMRSERTMSITAVAKHFGLHPKAEVFPYLRDRRYLTLHDLPSQSAIDAGYLVLRETKCPDGQVRPQAMVEVRMLETWRTRVVPQIARWKAEGAA